MPHIVQFTHPGKEHGHDKGNPTFKSWNFRNHRRKFLLCNGKYINSKNTVNEDSLVFWGEWEPPSEVSQLYQQNDNSLPKWLQQPLLPNVLKKGFVPVDCYENTDPYVFEGRFIYFKCKQLRNNNSLQTRMAQLEKGSLILFGSTVGNNPKTAFFQIDTVFVIADYIYYDPSKSLPKKMNAYMSNLFRQVSYDKAFPPNQVQKSVVLRFYVGATVDRPINGMYSFSPAKIWDKKNSVGFPRISIKDDKFITNNLNATPKTSYVND